ncbi:SulP family inorganic anion transporter [Acetobacter estunensis]|uniref:SulP family inorganic anion transporter n=1 Tax=Acetobacter estunensis TaxID=104097 RepID=UPI001C2D8D13|nr:SulP family inorganic anion transporter [Acetobacter estunensis]MBV1836495.1 SulP family inorganic anion transporter [Acetobacter estunensis]
MNTPTPQNRPPSGSPSFLRDVVAGLTLASVNIPQVLGYTRIAAMPAVTGLYTALLPPLAFALLGSSRHLVVAADSATAAILSGGLAPLAEPGSPHYVAMVGVVTLLCAAFLLVGRIFRLGFLADFLSLTVLMGFLTGVGLQVSLTMLPEMLGLHITGPTALIVFARTLTAFMHLHPLSAFLSLATVLCVTGGRRFVPDAPIPLLVIVFAIAASWYWHFSDRGVAVIGPVADGLPSLHLPWLSWNETLELLPVAASCVFVIIAQSVATARSFATRFHESLDADADILGLSAANLAAAISGAFTVNGSPTQTAMGVRAGARTQRAQVVFSLTALVVLLFLTAPLQFLPRCVLASIVLVIAMGMVNMKGIRALRHESPGEFRLALITAAAVVAINVQQGIFLAIAISLFRHVRHSYEPHTMILHPRPNGRGFEAEPATPGSESEPGLVIYRFGADLFYANSTHFADDIREIVAHAPSPVHCLVLDASAMTDIDYSAAQTMRELLAELSSEHVTVFLGRVSPWLRSDMDRHGLTALIGAERIRSTLHEAVEAAEKELPSPRTVTGHTS